MMAHTRTLPSAVTDKTNKPALLAPDAVREDWVPKAPYVSAEFAELERKYLWPRVWQMACREEDLPRVGSFVTYEILDESIIVVRTSATEIKAFNNACMHRGRRLTQGEGRTPNFVCKFHGWTWNLKGENIRVVDPEDWGRCLNKSEIGLHEFKVGCWGGFVFINMDPNAESFESFLGDVPEYLDCLEFEKQRYRWFISVEVEANWKTCQEAFMEAYHVQTTHKSIEPVIDSKTHAFVQGKHGRLQKTLLEPEVGRYNTAPKRTDQREAFLESIRINARDIGSIFCDRDLQAATRIMQALPPTATWNDAATKAFEFIKEAAEAVGAGYPVMTREQVLRAGFDWNIFPNMTNVLGPTTGLWYRLRPMPNNDPNRSIFDIFSLERFTPGSEPKVEKQHFQDWRDCEAMPSFLLEDFANIPDVQRGMRTRYWKGARPNPIQERMISNMHQVLQRFIQEGIEAERHA